MSKIAIVYHSGYGHTDVVAQELAHGVEEAGSDAALLRIDAGQTDFEPFFAEIADAGGVIFGSPTYMGTVSAPMKAFMDASSAPWFSQSWADKIAAGFTNSGSPSGDKLNTLQTLAIFAAQHSMLWIGTGSVIPPHSDTDALTDTPNRLGSFLGVMTQSSDESAEVTPKAGDRETARLLGERVAQAAARWVKGAV